uniref:Uncharacterized protein n=1 Tax=Rhizophora mucronata TaxID=61149 RepID=A0A2P2IHT1_RHIMU
MSLFNNLGAKPPKQKLVH